MSDSESILEGMVFSCTSIPAHLRSSTGAQIKAMGGSFVQDLLTDVTYLIVGDVATEKYKFVAKHRPEVMLLTPECIPSLHAKWIQGEEINDIYSELKKHALPVFYNLAICITNFFDSERTDIHQIISKNGGMYHPNLSRDVTHLVAASENGKKFQFARKWNIPIVSKQWITQSLKRGAVLDESCFAVNLSDDLMGKGSFEPLAIPTKNLYKKNIFLQSDSNSLNNLHTQNIDKEKNSTNENNINNDNDNDTKNKNTSTLNSTKNQNLQNLQDLNTLNKISHNPTLSRLRTNSDVVWNSLVDSIPNKIIQKKEQYHPSSWEINRKSDEDAQNKNKLLPFTIDDNKTEMKNDVSLQLLSKTTKELSSLSNNTTLTRKGLFSDLVFVAYGFNEKHASKLQSVIESNDGSIIPHSEYINSCSNPVKNTTLIPTHFIVPSTLDSSDLPPPTEIPPDTRVVTEWLIERALHYQSPPSLGLSPYDNSSDVDNIWGSFFPGRDIPEMRSLVISVSGFDGVEYLHISKLIPLLGATHSPALKYPHTNLLITNSQDGYNGKGLHRPKFLHALHCRIPILSEKWLWECAKRSELVKYSDVNDPEQASWRIDLPILKQFKKSANKHSAKTAVLSKNESDSKLPANSNVEPVTKPRKIIKYKNSIDSEEPHELENRMKEEIKINLLSNDDTPQPTFNDFNDKNNMINKLNYNNINHDSPDVLKDVKLNQHTSSGIPNKPLTVSELAARLLTNRTDAENLQFYKRPGTLPINFPDSTTKNEMLKTNGNTRFNRSRTELIGKRKPSEELFDRKDDYATDNMSKRNLKNIDNSNSHIDENNTFSASQQVAYVDPQMEAEMRKLSESLNPPSTGDTPLPAVSVLSKFAEPVKPINDLSYSKRLRNKRKS